MSDLHYLNARVGAMRGQFLDRQTYARILALPDLPAMIAYLRDGPYGRSIESVAAAASDTMRVEESLRRNFSETLAKLFAISTGEVQEGIRALLGYWDVYNLKTILRGKAAGISEKEILASLIPTGLYDEAALGELCRQPNLRAVADLLATWRDPYGRPLAAAMRDYREPRDLFFLESALDRFYFRQALERIGETPSRIAVESGNALATLLSLWVDRTNLMTALKAVQERIPLADRGRYFLPGGRIYSERDFFRLLSAADLREAFEAARRSVFETALRDPGESAAGISRLSILERELDRVLLRRMRALRRTDPLGMAPVVSYLLDKIREITNLRMILRARLVDLPEARLFPLLILEY